MKLKEFFDTEFKTFSNLDNVRSIPSVIDGLKDSQRKAVYGMLQNGQSEIKVAQAAGKYSLITHYNHGENSMADTIVGLAQNYPGSNNINLFEPIGQFGSILSSEASSPRYIYTKPSQHLRQYIRPEDDCILEHRYEDGDKAEPLSFYPLLPMWLVNGALGIGTGHSVKILPRDPDNMIALLERIISQDKIQQRTIDRLMMPHYVGWKGEVVRGDEDGKYELHGVLEVVNTTTIRITELPVGYGVDKFKSILVDLMDKGSVKDFDNNSTELGFDFTVKVSREVGKKSHEDLMKMFKLVTRQSENVTLWDVDDKLRQFANAYDAFKQFVSHRLERYETRRLKQLSLLEDDLDFLRNKKLFILEWNSLPNPGKMKTADIADHMQRKGVKSEYMDRLMSLRISSLTLDQISDLEKLIKKKKGEVDFLNTTTPKDMYLKDIEQIA